MMVDSGHVFSVLVGLCVYGSVPMAVFGDPIPVDHEALRLARSSDGLRFVADPGEFGKGLSSPDLERLPGGELIAVFDGPPSEGRASGGLQYKVSKDEGRTWSDAGAIRFEGSSFGRRQPRHGDLVVLKDGSLRLYFTLDSPGRGTSNDRRRSAVVRSAVAKDGLRFALDPRPALRLSNMLDGHACVVHFDKRFRMFVSGKERSGEGGLRSAISRDGRRFAPTAEIEFEDGVRVSSVLPYEEGFRAYGWTPKGIVSMVSDDGRTWRREAGIRLAEGWDPAVVRLKNGTFLMLYQAGPRPADVPTLASAEAVEAPGLGIDGLTADEIEAVTDDSFDEPDAAHEEDDGYGLARSPDYANPVDYNRWYHEQVLETTDDNAFDAYVAFMPKFDEDGVADRADWPEFHDMFNGGQHDGPPLPWDPKEHPHWEETHRTAREVLAKFREANQRTGYAARVDPTPDSDPAGPSEDRLLMNLQLPHLQPHRTLAKATLADAWRIGKDGKVDSDRMIDAWKTVLQGAEHIERGSTLIENLVGIAERGLVESNARWALQHGVFKEEQLERALDALREYDRNSTDVVKGVRGEHAMALDTTQYLFSPPDANGEPVVNPERVERLQEIMGDNSGTSVDDVAKMGPQDARATVDAFHNYYREVSEQLRIGYPEVRASDLEALAGHYVATSPITKMLLPSLSRVHALRTRVEASRRATQLAYAAHLHRARTGAWPRSLDELPSEVGETIRTDPFSDRGFGYRLTDDEPVIYSRSEKGLDDGAVHSPRWAPTEESDSDDFVFFPPQP